MSLISRSVARRLLHQRSQIPDRHATDRHQESSDVDVGGGEVGGDGGVGAEAQRRVLRDRRSDVGGAQRGRDPESHRWRPGELSGNMFAQSFI